jgi:DNA-3-methyladenine glycosylase
MENGGPVLRMLERSFYERDAVAVAKELLGKFLVHSSRGAERVGRIVEVEAYLGPRDLAAHSSRGRTERTMALFGPPGHAYVYLVYGIHCCLNVVTEGEGSGSAVLLRALEPIRNVVGRPRGPGLLCRAMDVDRRLNGHDLVSEEFHVAASGGAEPITIVRRPRIGVAYAGPWAKRLLRFYVAGSSFVSRR